MAGIAEERLGDRAANDHAGHAGQETARHHAAHSHAATPHTTEGTLHRAGSANFGTRGQAGQRLRIILHRDSSSAAFRIRHVGGQLLQEHVALLWRELRKSFGVRLFDGFWRCGLQHVAIGAMACSSADCGAPVPGPCDGLGCGASSRPNNLSRIPTCTPWLVRPLPRKCGCATRSKVPNAPSVGETAFEKVRMATRVALLAPSTDSRRLAVGYGHAPWIIARTAANEGHWPLSDAQSG